jgi:hypothetical protein
MAEGTKPPIAANDNTPQGGQYIGLTRQAATMQAYDESVEAWRASTDRKQSGLEGLAALPGYAYLASPYSKYPYGHAEAARVACAVTAGLMRRGIVAYSPIAHGHAVAEHGLPLDWPFWKRQCDPLLAGAAAMIVLQAHGWWDSVGMQYELDAFIGTGRPIQYVEPADFCVVEGV